MKHYYTFGDVVRKVLPPVTKQVTLPNTKHFNASHVLVEQFASGGPVTVLEQTGSIVYTRKHRTFKKRSNLCAHSRFERKMLETGDPPVLYAADLNPAHPGYTWEIYWDYPTSRAAHLVAVDTALTQFGSVGLAKLQAGWQNYAAIGFQAAQPDLNMLSLPNFVIDADQLGGLLTDVKHVKKAGQIAGAALLGRVATGGVTGVLPSLREAAKFIAGKRLSYKFGWKPTYGDLAGMLAVVTSLQTKLNLFKANIGKECHFTKTVETNNLLKSGTFNYLGDIHQKVNWRGTIAGVVKYHCTYIPQHLAVLNKLDESLKLSFEGFGYKLDPRIIWDAIPFSFIMDWFSNFGDWVHQFRQDALYLPIELVDSCVTYKEDYSVASELIVNPNGYPTDVTGTTKPAGFYTRNRFFHRMPVDPSEALYVQLGWKRPTGSQWTNLVSLATVLGL
jgi:hypothetical protein